MLQKAKKKLSETVGHVKGVISTGETVSDNYPMYQASKGHGFAAEKMNHLYDILTGKKAKLVGGDNAKNGADRIVNGQYIQSKFCATGKACINECFNEKGFKYVDSKGNPMVIEVPKDKYSEALKTMEDKIRQGKVPNIKDPGRAEELVKESPFTYEQAKNVAKFGTIDSLTFDAVEGIKVAGTSMGISAAISFGYSIWSGEEYEDALKAACETGIRVGGVSWLSNIAAKQLMRTSIARGGLKAGTDLIVKQMGPKTAAKIVNAVRSGSGIYGGAAMNSLSKMLRGNIATGIATTVVLSSADIYWYFTGKVSAKQVGKNVTKTGAGVVGGTAGWMGGATAGAAIGSVIPVVGTAVGGFIGGLAGAFAGGSLAQKAADTVLDDWLEIKDDIEDMLEYVNEEFSALAFDYILSEQEIENVLEEFKQMDLREEMMEMYSMGDARREYANELLRPLVEKEAAKREKIVLPKENKILELLKKIFL